MHKKYRSDNEIQTSYLVYDFTLIGIKIDQNHDNYPKELFDILRKEIREIYTYMNDYCIGYRNLYVNKKTPICDECDCYSNCIDKCFICTYIKYKQLKKDIHSASKLHKFDLLKIIGYRLEFLKNCWNYKLKYRECQQHLFFNEEISPFFFLFGNIGLVLMLPVSSPFWASRLRMGVSLIDSIFSTNNFPMHRIKSKYQIEKFEDDSIFKNEIVDVFPESNKQKFILYCFLQKPKDLMSMPKRTGTRAKYLKLLTNFILGNNSSEASIKQLINDQKFDYDSLRLNLFLSYSTSYPFVIKAEFQNIENVFNFISILNNQKIIGPFNTIIGWYDNAFFQYGVSETNDGNKTDFQLFLKTFRKPNQFVTNFLEYLSSKFYSDELEFEVIKVNSLNKNINAFENNWIERPYYWDISIYFKTNSIPKLLSIIFQDLGSFKNNIINMALTPVSLKNEKKFFCSPNKEIINNSKPIPDDTLHKEIWADGIMDLKQYKFNIDNTLDRACEDTLLVGWNNLRQECRWLVAYTSQLKKSWLYHANSFNFDDISKGMITFTGIISTLKVILSEILYHDNVIIKLNESLISTSAKKTKKLLFIMSWKSFNKYTDMINRVKASLITIKSEINTKIEAHQMINLTEPLITAGDPSGITDLTIEAARRLFRHYCSSPNIKSKLWGDNNLNNRLRKEWNGIVTSTTARDFQLILKWQMLYLPIDMKFKTQGKFLILAHEAAHQVIYWIEISEGVFQKMGYPPPSAKEHFLENIWNCLIGMIQKWLKKKITKKRVKSDIIYELSHYVSEVSGNTEGLYKYEFLCDILALLCAGPAYLRSLFNMLYIPKQIEKNSFIHPPMWLRLSILVYICQGLGWLKIKGDTKRNISEYNHKYDVFDIYKMAHHHFKKYELFNDVTLWDCLFDIDKLLERVDSTENRFEIAVLGMLSTPESRVFLMRIVEWAQMHGTNFLYYPLPDIDCKSSINEIKQSWELYTENILKINHYTGWLSDRMVYNDEIILKAPLKYISAASCMPDIIHPLYSTGKIMHSLCYAHDTGDYSDIFNQK